MRGILGTVEAIWRYPIKSTGGERLERTDVDERGIVGDRLYALRDADGKFGSGKNSHRFRRMDGLLELRSRYLGGTTRPELIDPHGDVVPDPIAYLRDYLGRDDVELVREGAISHFDQLPLSVLTTATLDWMRAAVPGVPVDERRFRPNLLIRTPSGTQPFVEDDWCGGSKARIGDEVSVEFIRPSERCVMINAAQRELPHSPLVLRTVARSNDNRLGALATVAAPGPVRIGDAFALVP